MDGTRPPDDRCYFAVGVGWLIVSGYLLYYVGDDEVRAALSVLHWAVGLLVPLGFLAHRQRPRR